MPRKWRNRIITRCSSNVNVAISVSKTLLQLDLVTNIERVVQCCHLASPNLKNSHVSSNNFHVSIFFHSREKIRIPYNLNAPRRGTTQSISRPPSLRPHFIIRRYMLFALRQNCTVLINTSMTGCPNKMPKQTLIYSVLQTILVSLATSHAGQSRTLKC